MECSFAAAPVSCCASGQIDPDDSPAASLSWLPTIHALWSAFSLP